MPLPEPSPPPRRAPRRRLFRLVALAFVLCVGAIVVIEVIDATRPPPASLELISPEEALRPVKPRPFASLRYQVRAILDPLLRHFRRRAPSISVQAGIYLLPLGTSVPVTTAVSSITNTDGLRAWIVPPADLDGIKSRIRAMPGSELVSRPTIWTGSGTPAILSVGQTIRMGGGIYSAGFHLAVTPRILPDSLSLTLAAWNADPSSASIPSNSVLVTNFIAACRVSLPPSGAMVLFDTAHTNDAGKLHCILVSATSYDAYGKPIGQAVFIPNIPK